MGIEEAKFPLGRQRCAQRAEARHGRIPAVPIPMGVGHLCQVSARGAWLHLQHEPGPGSPQHALAGEGCAGVGLFVPVFCVLMLSLVHVNQFSNLKVMMTLIASASMLMSDIHRRWLTSKEVLTVQGFPTDTFFTNGRPCSSYALRAWQARNGMQPASEPSRRCYFQQAGNSMHVAVSGIVLLYSLTQILLDPEQMQLQQSFAERAQALKACSMRMAQSSPSSSKKDSSLSP